jgi:TatD DNase family protein
VSGPGLVDTHAHLMDPAFDDDRSAVIGRARAAGVTAFILVGYNLATSRAAIELARDVPDAWAAVGIHPNAAAEASEADFATLADLARAPEVVAIGETGLDNYREFTPVRRQQQAFAWHLELAERLELPVIVHNRQADSDVASVVGGGNVRGILHCFSSHDPVFLDQMLAAGFHVSFAGPLTFKHAAPTRDMATRVPHHRLLVETDCPYLAPEPHRGRRNEPAYVQDTARCLATVLDMPFEQLVDTIWTNTLEVFPRVGRDQVAA